MPRQFTEQELQDVLRVHAENRRRKDEADQAQRRSILQGYRKDMETGRVTYACGPCRPCVEAVLSEIPRDMAKCLGASKRT